MIKADLHCHSTHSDGTLTPKEILSLAESLQISGLAITDHDTFSSFLEMRKYLPHKSVKVISGVELSTTLEDAQVHVLGYAFDPENSAFQEFCEIHRSQRLERNRQILEKLQKHGMKIEEEEIVKTSPSAISYGRPHIAKVMVEKGYVKDLIEAFRRYIGEGKPCYVAGKKWKTEEAIAIIHEAKGKAVIAHPHLLPGKSIIEKLLQFPFDGIEAFYCNFPETANQKWLQIAESKGWLATGGSDFHGTVKPDVKLGSSLTPEPTFLKLLHHFYEVVPNFQIGNKQ